jgi:cell wall-associated NlpC family hydrolase
VLRISFQPSPARAGLCHSESEAIISLKYTIIPIAAMLLAILFSAGCSTSSPRFAGPERKSKSTEPEPKRGPRFASKEAEEEKKENNVKVDPKEMKRIESGERDFREEKNPAIKPLDQSKMMREISKYMGVLYVSGGAGSDGMDCSGYTMVVYKNAVGVQLPRSCADQAKLGNAVQLNDLKFGDLVFFNTTGASKSHVGIYLGDDLFAHASVTLGVTISSLQSSYYSKRYETARRIIE